MLLAGAQNRKKVLEQLCIYRQAISVTIDLRCLQRFWNPGMAELTYFFYHSDQVIKEVRYNIWYHRPLYHIMVKV